MKTRRSHAAIAITCLGTPALAADGLAAVKSPHDARSTMDRLEAQVWVDSSSQAWLGYDDPAFLAKRHEVAQCPVAGNLAQALAGSRKPRWRAPDLRPDGNPP